MPSSRGSWEIELLGIINENERRVGFRSRYLPNKSIPSPNGPVELGRDPKVYQLDLSIVREENILSLNIPVNHFVGMEMGEAAEDLTTDVSNPLLFQRLAPSRLD